jgi:hypothetical protein
MLERFTGSLIRADETTGGTVGLDPERGSR